MVPTIEETIAAMNRRGWRLSCLAFVGQRQGYSCIIEKAGKGDSGRMFAFNRKDLSPTAEEALAEAWKNAQDETSDRVVEQGKPPRPPKVENDVSLEWWLGRNVALRSELMSALEAHIKCLRGEDAEDDDFL